MLLVITHTWESTNSWQQSWEPTPKCWGWESLTQAQALQWLESTRWITGISLETRTCPNVVLVCPGQWWRLTTSEVQVGWAPQELWVTKRGLDPWYSQSPHATWLRFRSRRFRGKGRAQLPWRIGQISPCARTRGSAQSLVFVPNHHDPILYNQPPLTNI